MTVLASKGRSTTCIVQEMVARHVGVLRTCVRCIVWMRLVKFPFPDAGPRPQRTEMWEALVKAQTGAPRTSFLRNSTVRAMMKMTKAQLQDAIRARGEEPPREWNNVELRDRLAELMEQHGEAVGHTSKTDLRQWMADLNKASRKKDQLKEFCEERLKISLSGNETIPVLQKKATRKIYEVSVASSMDPVGFGKWSTLSYGQLLREQPAYATWVQETLLEGGETCDYRLSRLGHWLMNQTDENMAETVVPTAAPKFTAPVEPKAQAKSMVIGTPGGKGYGSKTGNQRIRGPVDHNAPASSSSAGENPGTIETMKLLMDTMTAMKEEIKQLRENQGPEEPRRKKKEEAETAEATEKSFTLVSDP